MPEEDPVLKSARREAVAALLTFVLAILVTLIVCYYFGYMRPAGRPRGAPTFILGFPAWVFWGVILPWIGCILFGTWFAYRYMKDEDLGRDEDAPDGD